jgi:hypothetical protein
MEHELSISSAYIDLDGSSVRGVITVVKADTDLGSLPLYPYPESFDGRLVGTLTEGNLIEITGEQLDHFRFGREVRIDFIGKPYKFRRLEGDGAFEVFMSW